MTTESTLEERIHSSLDALLRALELERQGQDRFRTVGALDRFDRVFGGQTLAQALTAASATVEGKAPMSLHAYFVEGGTPGEPFELAVTRVRDGRSISTRRVEVRQGERTLLTAIASFHDNQPGPELADTMPPVPPPAELPRLQDWVENSKDRYWVDHPPPLDIHIGESLSFLGKPSSDATRSHWMRVPRDVGDDPYLNAALLSYASDYFLLDAVFRVHPDRTETFNLIGTSLDHAIWFHRPVRFDRWHLHTQQCVAIDGQRGLARGAIHDEEGHLVATTAQEVLVRRATSAAM